MQPEAKPEHSFRRTGHDARMLVSVSFPPCISPFFLFFQPPKPWADFLPFSPAPLLARCAFSFPLRHPHLSVHSSSLHCSTFSLCCLLHASSTRMCMAALLSLFFPFERVPFSAWHCLKFKSTRSSVHFELVRIRRINQARTTRAERSCICILLHPLQSTFGPSCAVAQPGRGARQAREAQPDSQAALPSPSPRLAPPIPLAPLDSAALPL
jgi:hypothetical protein